MQQRFPQNWLGRFALWSLVMMLLVSTWPELEVHDAASPEHPDETAHVHQGDAKLMGDPEGLHVHACHCTAHCTAIPAQLPPVVQARRAPLMARVTPHVSKGVTSPPFRPPIA